MKTSWLISSNGSFGHRRNHNHLGITNFSYLFPLCVVALVSRNVWEPLRLEVGAALKHRPRQWSSSQLFNVQIGKYLHCTEVSFNGQFTTCRALWTLPVLNALQEEVNNESHKGADQNTGMRGTGHCICWTLFFGCLDPFSPLKLCGYESSFCFW